MNQTRKYLAAWPRCSSTSSSLPAFFTSPIGSPHSSISSGGPEGAAKICASQPGVGERIIILSAWRGLRGDVDADAGVGPGLGAGEGVGCRSARSTRRCRSGCRRPPVPRFRLPRGRRPRGRRRWPIRAPPRCRSTSTCCRLSWLPTIGVLPLESIRMIATDAPRAISTASADRRPGPARPARELALGRRHRLQHAGRLAGGRARPRRLDLERGGEVVDHLADVGVALGRVLGRRPLDHQRRRRREFGPLAPARRAAPR